MRTRPLLLAIAIASISLQAQAGDLPKPRKLIDRHLKTVGGVDALSASVDGTARIRVDVAENGMRGDMVMHIRGSDMVMSLDIGDVGMNMRMGSLDGVSWSIDPMHGPRLIEGEELRQMQLRASSDRDLYSSRAIKSMKTVALSDSEGRPCYRVEIVWKQGEDSATCFGVADGLALSTESTSVSLTGKTRDIMHLYDYKRYGAFMMASRIRMKHSGLTQTLTIDSFEATPPPKELFALPPAIVALVEEGKNTRSNGRSDSGEAEDKVAK